MNPVVELDAAPEPARTSPLANSLGVLGLDSLASLIGPHIIVVLPDCAREALRGINQDLSNNEPYVTILNPSEDSTPLWVIPVAKGGERIKAERAK